MINTMTNALTADPSPLGLLLALSALNKGELVADEAYLAAQDAAADRNAADVTKWADEDNNAHKAAAAARNDRNDRCNRFGHSYRECNVCELS